MEHLEFVVDPFCEKAFWTEHKNEIFPAVLTNPVCAFSGLVMVVMALGSRNLMDNASETFPTLSITLLSLCRGSRGIVGVGTAVFHVMDDQTNVQGFNFRMCDRMPIILMCSNVFVLYFVKLKPSIGERALTWFYFLMYIYIGGLILAVDSTTYEYLTLKRDDPLDSTQSSYEGYMNIALLAPLGVILLIAMRLKFTGWQTIWILIQIIFSLGIWCIDAYLCRKYTWLFVLHAVYHVTIAYTFLYAACLAMTFDDEWVMVEDGWWPMVKQTNTVVMRSKFQMMSPCDIKIHLKP